MQFKAETIDTTRKRLAMLLLLIWVGSGGLPGGASDHPSVPPSGVPDAAPLDAPGEPPSPARTDAPSPHGLTKSSWQESERRIQLEDETADPEEDVLRIQLPPALLSTSDELNNTNLLAHPHERFRTARTDEYRHLLKTAIRQRRQKLYGLAANNLDSLLAGGAPLEFKRSALLELALVAEDQGHYNRAIQIYSQFQKYFDGDAIVPEIFLRQGLLLRRLGAPTMALSKFFAVLSSAVNLKSGNVEYHQKLVLQAQIEIADTYLQQGRLLEAADAFQRLLKQDTPGANESEIQFKLVRCWSGLGEDAKTVEASATFLEHHGGTTAEPEVRFILSNTYMKMGQNAAALEQVFHLLESQQRLAGSNPTNWVYWQQRAGNQIANQLYQEGDFLSALHVYNVLAELNAAPSWQVPVWYQIGLIFEKLEQPAKAVEYYAKIGDREMELPTRPSPNLKTVLDMARWRKDFLNWQIEVRTQRLGPANEQARLPATRALTP